MSFGRPGPAAFLAALDDLLKGGWVDIRQY
jgi:hypothetical protein